MRATTFLTLSQLRSWCKVTPGVSKSVSALISSAGVARATCTGHGFKHGDTVTVAGAAQSEYNISATITVIDANTFTYPINGSPASPATGTITAISERDAILTVIADRVCEGLEDATGQIFAKRTGIAEVRNGDGRRTLYLRKYPLISIESFSIDGTTVPSSDYVLELEDACVRMKYRTFPAGVGNVVLSYTAGYEPASIPARAIGAALDIAKVLFDKYENGTISMSSITAGPASVTAIEGLPRHIRDEILGLSSARMIG